MKSVQVKVENQGKPATRKQLWALFVASKRVGEKHDYRNDSLTMLQASELLAKFNAQTAIAPIGVQTTKVAPKNAAEGKKKGLSHEFTEFMTEKMKGVIATARQALNVKSVIEDDTHIPEKDRKRYAFVGFGCGFTIIEFDKRSKLGKAIKEMAINMQCRYFLDMFLAAFTKEEKDYLNSIGCPLTAIYHQDIRINGAYEHAVAEFMTLKGVKNVRCRTYYD